MCNLNLSGTTYTQAVIAPDTSTSYGFQGTGFTGIFDGSGHVISNLTITAPTQDYIGLFGYVGSGGQVWNLGLEDADITGRDNVGGLVGGGPVRLPPASGMCKPQVNPTATAGKGLPPYR